MHVYKDYRLLYFGIDEMDYVKLMYRTVNFVPIDIEKSLLQTDLKFIDPFNVV